MFKEAGLNRSFDETSAAYLGRDDDTNTLDIFFDEIRMEGINQFYMIAQVPIQLDRMHSTQTIDIKVIDPCKTTLLSPLLIEAHTRLRDMDFYLKG